MSDRVGQAAWRAAIAAAALAGCVSRQAPAPRPAPAAGDPPASRPAFVEEFRQAAQAMAPAALARFVAFQDPLEEEYFRLHLPKEPAKGDLPRVDIVYARAIPPDWYFVCLLASNLAPPAPKDDPAALEKQDAGLVCTFRKVGDRWITRDLPSLRDIAAPEDILDYMRWKTVERLADVRFGPAPPSVWIDEMRARFEAVQVLSGEPYRLLDPERLDASRESLARLTALPDKTPDALARAMAENLPPSFFNIRGYTLAFFLEAKEGEAGIRVHPREAKEPILVESLPVLHDGAVTGAEYAPVEGDTGPATVTFTLTPAGAEILKGIAEKRGGESLVVIAGGEAIGATRIPAQIAEPKLAVGPVAEESAQILAKAGNAYAKAARAILEKLRAGKSEP